MLAHCQSAVPCALSAPEAPEWAQQINAGHVTTLPGCDTPIVNNLIHTVQSSLHSQYTMLPATNSLTGCSGLLKL